MRIISFSTSNVLCSVSYSVIYLGYGRFYPKVEIAEFRVLCSKWKRGHLGLNKIQCVIKERVGGADLFMRMCTFRCPQQLVFWVGKHVLKMMHIHPEHHFFENSANLYSVVLERMLRGVKVGTVKCDFFGSEYYSGWVLHPPQIWFL